MKLRDFTDVVALLPKATPKQSHAVINWRLPRLAARNDTACHSRVNLVVKNI
jgi:hypothetical protein